MAIGEHLVTHGLTRGQSLHGLPPEYRIWRSMKDRCLREKATVYRYYGGRGITVCERWRDSFPNFIADMGQRPAKGTLERRDNDGHYSPENCFWASRIEQANNKRNNVMGLVNGQRMTAAEAARITGLPYWTVRRRMLAGKPLH